MAVTASVTLDSPLQRVKMIGPVAARKLEQEFGYRTVRDLLYHFPRRLFRRGELTSIASLREKEHVTIQARVQSANVVPNRTKSGVRFEAKVTDGSGKSLTLTFFGKHASQFMRQQRELVPGRDGLFSGTVSLFRGRLELTHPEFRMQEADFAAAEQFANQLLRIYPATQHLQSWMIDDLIGYVLMAIEPPPDPIPEPLRRQHGLLDFNTALRQIHRPDSEQQWERARRRLKWDQALAVQLALGQRRRRTAALAGVPRPPRPGGLLAAFDARLPFELTAGQAAVCEQLERELAQPHPMHRLLQGEVGSGKTVCALRAMLQVVDSGGQAALLAPTEVLAAQHYRSITGMLGPLGCAGELGAAEPATRVALVTGSQGAAARRQAAAEVSSGAAGIVVGTHALLYERVEFADLGLVVVDEQHRFGVQQRDALRTKAKVPPHTLVMTATPIPRTVAMTVFGDLEVSTLTELPKGRSPIATHVISSGAQPRHLDRAWQRLRERVAAGQQAYIVYPRIGGDASADDVPEVDVPETGVLKTDVPEINGREAYADPSIAEARRPPRPALAVLEQAPKLIEGELAGVRVGVLHGRLPSDEKDAVMRAFAAGNLDVLIATTVIEVGVDVPNATMMLIFDADRFGISQLHQLRGRIGRGSAPSLCLLVTDAPPGSRARQRLEQVASTLDGFELAELDLQERREGDVLGEAQSGTQRHLQLLSLLEDRDVIESARAAASELLDADPELAAHPALAAEVAAIVGEDRAEFLERA